MCVIVRARVQHSVISYYYLLLLCLPSSSTSEQSAAERNTILVKRVNSCHQGLYIFNKFVETPDTIHFARPLCSLGFPFVSIYSSTVSYQLLFLVRRPQDVSSNDGLCTRPRVLSISLFFLSTASPLDLTFHFVSHTRLILITYVYIYIILNFIVFCSAIK